MLSLELSDIADELFHVERMARELATDVQLGRKSWRDVYATIDDIYSLISAIDGELSNILQDMEAMDIPVIDDYKLSDILEAIGYARSAIWHVNSELAEKYAYSSKQTNVEITDPRVDIALDNLEEKVRELIGKGCRYRISNRLSSYLNDLASCIHRIAEYVSRLHFEKKGKCNIVKPSDKGLAFCLEWNKAADRNKEDGLYDMYDYEALEGWIVGDKVYLKVGSAEGHRTIVDLSSGKLEYWDTDENVNTVMKELLEKHAGLSCTKTWNGVECTGVNPENMKKVAHTLSLATSMDLRIKDPTRYWPDEYREIGEEAMALERLKELGELLS